MHDNLKQDPCYICERTPSACAYFFFHKAYYMSSTKETHKKKEQINKKADKNIGTPLRVSYISRMRSSWSTLGARAGAARVTAVCQSAAIFALYTGFGAIPTSSELREHVKQNGDFPETTAFQRYAVKNDNMHKSHQLPRPIRLLSVPCGGTRSNHEAVYRLPHRHAIL